VLWDVSRGSVTVLGEPIIPDVYYQAQAMSRDGTTVVGVRTDTSRSEETIGYAFEPFHWTSAEGAAALGPLPAGARHGDGSAISHDGSVLAGRVYDDSRAVIGIYRWTRAGGAVLVNSATNIELPPLLNGDGSVLVGVVDDSDNRLLSFRWTGETGAVAIESGAGRSNIVDAVSGDGNIIVGRSLATRDDLYDETSPFVWRSGRGSVDLAEALASAGVDLSGWAVGQALGLSGDSRVIVGRATCGGLRSVYRAVLP
jgi:uncharacterized membrane protein